VFEVGLFGPGLSGTGPFWYWAILEVGLFDPHSLDMPFDVYNFILKNVGHW